MTDDASLLREILAILRANPEADDAQALAKIREGHDHPVLRERLLRAATLAYGRLLLSDYGEVHGVKFVFDEDVDLYDEDLHTMTIPLAEDFSWKLAQDMISAETAKGLGGDDILAVGEFSGEVQDYEAALAQVGEDDDPLVTMEFPRPRFPYVAARDPSGTLAPSEEEWQDSAMTKTSLAISDYPLAEKRPEIVAGPRGKRLDEITLDALLAGAATIEDLRITPGALEQQAEIATAAGRPTLGENFRRAAELVHVPQDVIMRVYELLRPGRAKGADELRETATMLRDTYGAKSIAIFIEEAAAVYERRGLFRRRF